MTTTLQDVVPTVNYDGVQQEHENELTGRYRRLVDDQRLSWTTHQGLIRLLGEGGQGAVYLSERRGADGFTLPIAVKIFSPKRYETAREYEHAMARMARVAARVAQIQQDNLLDVHNFVDRNRVRMMSMEWVDGYDLSRVLRNDVLDLIYSRVSTRRWEYFNRVVVTAGPAQPRVRPGVAVAILRDCLAALAALHRDGIVHGDVKPANIMLKCTGNAKIVDIGSAFEMSDPPLARTCTPRYAAPEVLDGGECTAPSDLASLGYALIEMLSGQPLFAGLKMFRDLLEAKRLLTQRLEGILPEEVACNDLLMAFCRGLIAPDPMLRFRTAEEAVLVQNGAAAFQRQLVMGDLSVEYDNELRLWVEELKELEDEGVWDPLNGPV